MLDDEVLLIRSGSGTRLERFSLPMPSSWMISPPAWSRTTIVECNPVRTSRAGARRVGSDHGAAFGAKVAQPNRDVILTSGDGYLMFGTPLPALWCSSHYKAPYLTVVMVNKSYSTGTTALRSGYPEGVAVSASNYEGGIFDPPPNFARLAEAGNGYGEQSPMPIKLRGPPAGPPAHAQQNTGPYCC